MSQEADAVVVGAGVIGSAIALELARAGRRVVVLDKGGIGDGSTSASSAIIRFHYSSFTAVAAAWEARQLWADWQEHLGFVDPAGLAGFVRTGMLVLEPVPGGWRPTADLFDAVGVPWEEWRSFEIIREVPGLDPGEFGPPEADRRPGLLRRRARPADRDVHAGRGLRRRPAAGRPEPRGRGPAARGDVPPAPRGGRHRRQRPAPVAGDAVGR